MLVIRMARVGRNKYPTYRLVAAEAARPVTGKFVAILGSYNPHTKQLVLNKDQALEFMKQGAQPSNAVMKLLLQEKVDVPAWAKLKTKNRAPKAKAQEAKTAAAEPKADAEVEPTSSEESTADDAKAAAKEATPEANVAEEKTEADQSVPDEPTKEAAPAVAAADNDSAKDQD